MRRALHLRLLRGPLLLAGILITAGVAALWTTHSLGKAATQAHEQATRQYNQATRQVMQARTDEGSLRATVERYEALARTGVVGPEDRLGWLEALDAARTAHDIATIRYEIQPQQAVDDDAPEGLRWMESRMRLELGLRHAEALLHLLDSLRAVNSAVVVPERCTLTRASTHDGLDGRCELRWLTLQATDAS